jgi:Uma2 family endonuclease
MAVGTQHITVEEFDQCVDLPENAEKLFEYVGGEVVEVPSNPYASKVASRISGFIFMYRLENDMGHLTGEQGGLVVSGERYTPDVAFASKARQSKLVEEGFNPIPPDLAVEVEFPVSEQSHDRLVTKIANYLAAGTVVWAVYPETRQVRVFAPGQPVQIIDSDGVLDGGDVLPGFTLAVSDIFPET